MRKASNTTNALLAPIDLKLIRGSLVQVLTGDGLVRSSRVKDSESYLRISGPNNRQVSTQVGGDPGLTAYTYLPWLEYVVGSSLLGRVSVGSSLENL